ncbi:peptide-methionine (R)-S-oxide reductase MsrB [Luminiphilus sp.]|jgi:peptide-methionine (R)-S-oxide reductase|nr:peptide-methionine (R)-S-oxide reductase MsrB [Luminiphilus sp.]MDB4582494.1 peptide-methionine (R)-S-oxide reductase MsrB [Draconibacterium sp.]MDA8660613.1 peptide-methionine (R)-S-oxide reductase MsrB [Luminiphilus sp.]MDA8826756.1 peptide-methionine (R)-S-oxide reductase MsrB [Luminiphilus sp.]MDA9848047.1 peptide-methionine (R)-S-oxide reductase MsrB [Luminiphilus sp.]
MADDEKNLTQAQWRARLSADEYTVLREKGTERAFSGEYWNVFEDGMYHCRGCGEALFESTSKFDAGCGWPSFDRAASAGVVTEDRDMSHGMVRTEILCEKCGGHLGHVFPDGPTDTGLRYCVNSLSVKLQSSGE